MSEVLVRGPGDIAILPASSGVKALTNLSESQHRHLVVALEEIETIHEKLLNREISGRVVAEF